jgi:hypothetical protein
MRTVVDSILTALLVSRLIHRKTVVGNPATLRTIGLPFVRRLVRNGLPLHHLSALVVQTIHAIAFLRLTTQRSFLQRVTTTQVLLREPCRLSP